LQPLDLLGDLHALLRRYVVEQSEVKPDFSTQIEEVKKLFSAIAERAEQIDSSLAPRAIAHAVKATKQISELETRLVRTLKKQQSDSVERIQNLRSTLLPGGGLQERKESFALQYATYGTHFFDCLLRHFDPLDMRLKVFVERPESEREPEQ
jgi:uncharacterized protein YllA (UPF0747 family)